MNQNQLSFIPNPFDNKDEFLNDIHRKHLIFSEHYIGKYPDEAKNLNNVGPDKFKETIKEIINLEFNPKKLKKFTKHIESKGYSGLSSMIKETYPNAFVIKNNTLSSGGYNNNSSFIVSMIM